MTHLPQLPRREFLALSAEAMAAVLLAGCSSDSGDVAGPNGNGEVPGEAVQITGNTITVRLSVVPALSATPGFLLISQARVVVIHTSGNDYRAFTSVCTHGKCDVNAFSGDRIRCPCHGSEYDTDGMNVAGPAQSPLTPFALSLDSVAQTLTITTS